jgi:hypothetical protein
MRAFLIGIDWNLGDLARAHRAVLRNQMQRVRRRNAESDDVWFAPRLRRMGSTKDWVRNLRLARTGIAPACNVGSVGSRNSVSAKAATSCEALGNVDQDTLAFLAVRFGGNADSSSAGARLTSRKSLPKPPSATDEASRTSGSLSLHAMPRTIKAATAVPITQAGRSAKAGRGMPNP